MLHGESMKYLEEKVQNMPCRIWWRPNEQLYTIWSETTCQWCFFHSRFVQHGDFEKKITHVMTICHRCVSACQTVAKWTEKRGRLQIIGVVKSVKSLHYSLSVPLVVNVSNSTHCGFEQHIMMIYCKIMCKLV